MIMASSVQKSTLVSQFCQGKPVVSVATSFAQPLTIPVQDYWPRLLCMYGNVFLVSS